MIVGITGGIGTGKSTIAKVFATLGVPIYDADSAAKKIMQTNSAVITNIKKHFGEAAYINGEVNRKYIANIVFANKEKLQLLNSIVHPYSIADAAAWAAIQNAAYSIKEAALLFESEAFHYVDYSIGVAAPMALRLQRIMLRDAITKEAAIARMDKQMDENIKLKLCDYIITNNEASLIIPQVLHLHHTFIKMCAT